MPTPVRQSRELDHARWFAEEVQPHEPALRAYLRHKYPSVPDVDDVVQEAFAKVFAALKAGRLTSAKGLLFRVARNTVVSVFRKRKYISACAVSESAELGVLESDTDVAETVCSNDELELISEAIASLPARCRDVVMLRLMHGQDYRDIALELGLSESTVRVQVTRGMKKCTEFLRTRGVI